MVRDPRLTPARPELAAKYLQGEVAAARFVDGVERVVAVAQAPLRRAPVPDAALDTEALAGERVTVYEFTEEGWAWGQLAGDHYVGWLPEDALVPPGPAPTHRVAALRTLIFPGPSIKAPPIGTLPLGAKVAIARIAAPFAVMADGGHLPLCHLAALKSAEDDFVAVAERFLGTPYLWGGKTNAGIDCSGLVQVALTACGIACPRDSDMQQAALGDAVPPDGAFMPGDLLFWAGHVGIARDDKTLLHANAFHMAVVAEPLRPALARIAASGSPLAEVRRLGGA